MYDLKAMGVDEAMRRVAANLRRLRRAADFEQSDLAEALGITCIGAATMVSRWESGASVPKLDSLLRALALLEG